MKILCVTLQFVLMKKTNLRYTLLHTPVQQPGRYAWRFIVTGRATIRLAL